MNCRGNLQCHRNCIYVKVKKNELWIWLWVLIHKSLGKIHSCTLLLLHAIITIFYKMNEDVGISDEKMKQGMQRWDKAVKDMITKCKKLLITHSTALCYNVRMWSVIFGSHFSLFSESIHWHDTCLQQMQEPICKTTHCVLLCTFMYSCFFWSSFIENSKSRYGYNSAKMKNLAFVYT